MTAPVIAWGTYLSPWVPPTGWDPNGSGTIVDWATHLGMSGSHVPVVGVTSGALENGDGSFTMTYEVTTFVNDAVALVGTDSVSGEYPSVHLRAPEGLWGTGTPESFLGFPPSPNIYNDPELWWDDEYPPTVYYIVAINPVTNVRSENRAVIAFTGGGASWGGTSYQNCAWFVEPDLPPSPYFWTRLKRTVELLASP